MGHGSRLSDVLHATAESRIGDEYTAPLWSWARRGRRHFVTPNHARHASSFKYVFLVLLLLHLENPWTFAMHWKLYSLFLSLFAQHVFSTHPHSLMFSYSCTFYFPHVFLSSHDRCISHQLHILFLKFLHVDFFSISLFLYPFPPCSCIISFSSLMRLNFNIVICLI